MSSFFNDEFSEDHFQTKVVIDGLDKKLFEKVEKLTEVVRLEKKWSILIDKQEILTINESELTDNQIKFLKTVPGFQLLLKLAKIENVSLEIVKQELSNAL
jgi:hypothetical protein